jgi:hypothetical protein
MPDHWIAPVPQVSANVTVAGGVARLLMARHAGGAAGHIRGTVAVLIL